MYYRLTLDIHFDVQLITRIQLFPSDSFQSAATLPRNNLHPWIARMPAYPQAPLHDLFLFADNGILSTRRPIEAVQIMGPMNAHSSQGFAEFFPTVHRIAAACGTRR